MICMHCSNRLKDSYKFCRFCGKENPNYITTQKTIIDEKIDKDKLQKIIDENNNLEENIETNGNIESTKNIKTEVIDETIEKTSDSNAELSVDKKIKTDDMIKETNTEHTLTAVEEKNDDIKENPSEIVENNNKLIEKEKTQREMTFIGKVNVDVVKSLDFITTDIPTVNRRLLNNQSLKLSKREAENISKIFLSDDEKKELEKMKTENKTILDVYNKKFKDGGKLFYNKNKRYDIDKNVVIEEPEKITKMGVITLENDDNEELNNNDSVENNTELSNNVEEIEYLTSSGEDNIVKEVHKEILLSEISNDLVKTNFEEKEETKSSSNNQKLEVKTDLSQEGEGIEVEKEKIKKSEKTEAITTKIIEDEKNIKDGIINNTNKLTIIKTEDETNRDEIIDKSYENNSKDKIKEDTKEQPDVSKKDNEEKDDTLEKESLDNIANTNKENRNERNKEDKDTSDKKTELVKEITKEESTKEVPKIIMLVTAIGIVIIIIAILFLELYSIGR